MPRDAPEEVGRRAVVDRHGDDARSRQPQSATIHSGRFSAQNTTVSPLREAGRVRAGRRRRARRAPPRRTCARGGGSRCRGRGTRRGWRRGRRRSRSASRGASLHYDTSGARCPRTCRPRSPSARCTTRFLQSALRQFFERATLETEPILSASLRRPAGDRAVRRSVRAGRPLVRHALHAARARAAAVHGARDRGSRGRSASVLAARYRAILNPQADGRARRAVPRRHRGPLRRRVPRRRVRTDVGDGRAARRPHRVGDRGAARRRALAATRTGRSRPACCCSAPSRIPLARDRPRPPGAHDYTQALTGVKSFFRLADGLRTLFLARARRQAARHHRRAGSGPSGAFGQRGAAGAVLGAVRGARARDAPAAGTSAWC